MHLTPRQVEVCILAGCCNAWLSNKAIARELGISIHTVDAHLRDGAARIREAHPGIGAGSPRLVCQAWVRIAYHALAVRSISAAA